MKKTQRAQSNNKRVRVLSILVFVVSLLLVGASLAAMKYKDSVTNKLYASSYEISLYEHNWVATGEDDAQKMEPGMVIDKDPNVLNNSDDIVYVRMKIVILDENGMNITDSDRGQRILGALYIDDKNTLMVLDSSKNIATPVASQNKAFAYDDGWFYYVKPGSSVGDKSVDANSVLGELPAGIHTDKLFSKVKVPVLKSEYYGTFDKEFRINIIAQGLPVNRDVDGNIEARTLEDVIEGFNKEYTTYNFE